MPQHQRSDSSSDFIEDINETIDLNEYLRVIIKRRRSITVIFSLITGLGLIYCLTATPIYQATTGIIIDKEENAPGSLQETVFNDTAGAEYYQTLQKIIESRTVALKVVKQLGLDKNEAFFPQERDEDTDNETYEEQLIESFLRNLKIVPAMKSHYFNINFQSKDPALAAAVANTLVEAYREHALAMKLDSVQNSITWLNSNLEQERIKVEAAQGALLQYKEDQGIVTDFSTSAETMTAQKLALLNTQLAEAEAVRTQAETRYNQAAAFAATADGADKLNTLPDVLASELVLSIKTQEVALLQKRSELSKKYGANHPQMLALQSELSTLQLKRSQEVQRILGALNNTWQAALAHEITLRQALAEQKKEAQTLNRTAISYTGLYCEAEGAQTMYALLLKKLKETSVMENLKIGNIRVVDKAKKPVKPIKPRKMLYMLFTIMIALGVAVGSAFLREYLHDEINSPEDIKEHLRVPFLGIIPMNRPKKTEELLISPALETFYVPRSPISEAYRGVRTNIFYSMPEAEPQVILFTSTIAQEGKSTTAANVSITMAQFGYSVVLLDCDFHRGQIRKIFDIPQDEGMTNLLVGNKKIDEVVCTTTVPNLHLIPCGPIPPNPSEILGSKKMQSIVHELRGRFDKVIIDSAPVALVTDTLMAARAVDGIVFIIRANSTPRKAVIHAIESLQSVGAPLLGAVINGFDSQRDKYYWYSHYQYGYSYNEIANDKKQGLLKRLPIFSCKELKKKINSFLG